LRPTIEPRHRGWNNCGIAASAALKPVVAIVTATSSPVTAWETGAAVATVPQVNGE
jgi:hypothetical protein